MLCSSRLLSRAIWTASSTASLFLSNKPSFSAASLSNSVPLFQKTLSPLRSSINALTSGKPASSRTVVQPLSKTNEENSIVASRSQSMRAASSCLLDLFNLDDRFIRHFDGESNSVAKLESVNKRRRLDTVAHGHGIHETFDRAMFNDNLRRVRHGRDHFTLGRYRLRAHLFLRRNNRKPRPRSDQLRTRVSEGLRRYLPRRGRGVCVSGVA